MIWFTVYLNQLDKLHLKIHYFETQNDVFQKISGIRKVKEKENRAKYRQKNYLETNSLRKANSKVRELCSCRGFQGDSENALQNLCI